MLRVNLVGTGDHVEVGHDQFPAAYNRFTGLVKTGHFKVVERAVLDDVMTENSLQQGGEILDSIDVRREVKKSGVSGGHYWGIGGGVEISNALDLAVLETLDEAVYQLATRYGAR